MTKREWRRIVVTRRQASEMADAIFYLQQRAEQLAEIANVAYKPTVQERVALHELRVRLYAAAGEDQVPAGAAGGTTSPAGQR